MNDRNSLLHKFKTSKIFINDKTINISGVDGKANMFMSDKGFYDLDQFDIKSVIESLFDTLTDIQQQNLARQLEERRNE